MILLAINIYNNYQKQYKTIINSYLELEAAIIKEAARASSLWFHKRISEKNATIGEIEQEIFNEFIDPIQLLENGDAWIYNKDYVIFDQSSDFPEKYRGKSIREIFDIQKKSGARHYDDLIHGIENATEGSGWYVWLPEKGKEWAAWTSFKFYDQTWTLGLSTPENEILEKYDIWSFLTRQITYSGFIVLILFLFLLFILKYQRKQAKLIHEINDVNRTLKNIDSMKNNFIANISHDFRTPLTIIFNLAELNLNGQYELSPDIKEDLEVIYKTSYKFLSKINTLLDLTKLKTSGLDLKIGEISLRDFISSIAAYYRSALKHTGIILEADIPAEDSGPYYTDFEKLEDIINNLISNAVKFVGSENGKIKIELKEETGSAEIRIIDNGIGIEKEMLDIIFNRFIQSDNSYEINYKGSGIGLSYSKQLAELLGGSIKAESDGVNRGAVFTLSLDKNKFRASDIKLLKGEKPYIPKKVLFDTGSNDHSGLITQISETNRQNEFNPYKGIILVVEDEYSIREIIIRYLKSGRYKNFITASDGQQALKMISKYHPDLIITDYIMPNMNGDEFHSIVCRDPDFEFIPFIFISAIADERVIMEHKMRGAVDFLLKPIKKDELMISVNTHMKKYMDFIKLSAVDELTKLFNRRAFFKNFENLILSRTISEFSLILLDLDHFKEINDTYGHQAGDYTLSVVSSAILQIIRSHDIAGRYGGDEFAIILPETNIDSALVVAEKIRKAVEYLDLPFKEKKIVITISGGISSVGQCEKNSNEAETKINQVSEMIDMADIALYYAKSSKCESCSFVSNNAIEANENHCPECGGKLISGRNRIRSFDPKMSAFCSLSGRNDAK